MDYKVTKHYLQGDERRITDRGMVFVSNELKETAIDRWYIQQSHIVEEENSFGPMLVVLWTRVGRED